MHIPFLSIKLAIDTRATWRYGTHSLMRYTGQTIYFKGIYIYFLQNIPRERENGFLRWQPFSGSSTSLRTSGRNYSRSIEAPFDRRRRAFAIARSQSFEDKFPRRLSRRRNNIHRTGGTPMDSQNVIDRKMRGGAESSRAMERTRAYRVSAEERKKGKKTGDTGVSESAPVLALAEQWVPSRYPRD